MTYTDAELMVATAARELRDGESVFAGLGLPSVACTLAKRTHAPDIRIVYESGIVGADPTEQVPYAIAAPELVRGTTATVPMVELFDRYLQGGKLDVGFLGGAQVDRYGNINSTVIGDYDDPDVRLPGSGGACEIACNVPRTLIVMPHERRRFPESVDFVTSPGYVGGREGRAARDLPGGPAVVITDKAVLRFDDAGEAYVDQLHPGVERGAVQAATGWDLAFADEVGETPPPDEATVRLVRERLDPDGTHLGED
ncbi:MAG: CoA-transferase subunit beta [Haloarculaceae archaeon]